MFNIFTIGELKIQISLRFHHTPVRITRINKAKDISCKDVERGEQSSTAGGQDPTIPLLGIYLKNVPSYHKDICSAMSILALLARIWKQPRYSSTEERINNWYFYSVEYYSAVKNDIIKFAGTWTELEKK